MARRSRRNRRKPHVAADIELMPMLNVFIAIIPLLLLSAAFVQVSVIQATLPASAIAAEAPAAEEPLDLAVVIRRDAYVVEGNGLATVTIPRAADANARALAALSEALAGVVAAHPGQREVRVVSQSNTRYEDIVQVMDASRAAGLPEAALEGADSEVS
jgi:biopolymer transport protein ExbD